MRAGHLASITIATTIVVALCGCPSKPPAVPPSAGPATSPKTAPTAAEFLRRGHAALGHLENGKLAEADAELQKILDARPNDLFASRNLAVCRQLQFDALDPVRDRARFEVAQQHAYNAVTRLAQLEPTSAVPLVLKSRVAAKSGDKAATIAALEQAVQLEPANAPAWWELYSTLGGGHLGPNDASREAILNAGRKVYELQPDNWFFLKDWFNDLAAAKDPSLRTVLEQFRPQIEPFAAVMERDLRANPLKLIDAALTALSDNNFTAAAGPTRALGNILGPELPFDSGRLKINSLEWLRRDFDESFDREVGRPPVEPSPPIPVQFASANLKLPELPGGSVRDLAWTDFDVDGRSDLMALTATHLVALTRINGEAWHVAVATPVGEGWHRLHAADLDDDDPPRKPEANTAISSHLADPDVVLTGTGGVLVLENRLAAEGTREFLPHSESVPWSDVREVTASLLADLDHDGDLDALVAAVDGVHVYSQRGSFQFLDISNRSLLPMADVRITAAAAADWDRDADLDLLLSTTAGLHLLENVRHGRFRDRLFDGPLGQLLAAKALRVGDFDGDGAWDLLAAGDSGVLVIWMQPNLTGSGVPALREIEQIYARPASGAALWDFDNDGFTDFVIETASAVRAFRQEAPGRFVAVDVLPAECVGLARPVDLDGDGDLDLFTGEHLLAWRNDGGNANHWLDVRVRGLQEKGGAQSNSRRVNHHAIGSTIELRTGSRYQAAIVDGPITHFGLGQATQADLLRVIWTNGIPQDVVGPQVDAVLFEEQLPFGSCPYLYTWNGERFVYCTDLLWNAPLGLRFAEDAIAPWREWEYLKIDGDKLRPRNGHYVLQITEELWEAAYFDQVKLYAVDHPADLQVFTNEKVGPADLATPMLHTVRHPRRPVAARDTQGRDVLPQVSAADGDYAKTYDEYLAAGLVSDHFLELDLGDVREAQRITLFLTGWMFPTDTSQRMQFSQHPLLPLPRPPSLWTPDAEGNWREVRPFLGFIGGKPKTIALDVTGAFLPGDYRLRIATNMEFYWDDVFFTVDEGPLPWGESDPGMAIPGSPVRVHELVARSAELHHRGFSQAVYRPGYGPEWYDYERVNREPRWPPMFGTFTRYGDVLPLLTERDDRLAVFGAGDEMTVTFAVPPESLPAGWVRDFVLFNVGWDKDANLNTVYGDAVEPLPFQAMTVYSGLERRLRDDAYDLYLQHYQTRRQEPARFWSFVRTTPNAGGVKLRSRFER